MGGLCQHTMEVVELSLAMAKTYSRYESIRTSS
jgi:hypothetical protein